MKLSDFDYKLPRELIAQEPISKRDKSKLLILNNNKIEHKKFFEIIGYLHKGDVLVINETKVKKAMLNGFKSTGTKVDLILEKKLDNDLYLCRIRTKNPKPGNILLFGSFLKGEIVGENNGCFKVRFDKNPFRFAKLPTPFYVRKELKKQERYQTIYSKKEGSLAAPTAGLHFTKKLIGKIQKKGVKIARIVLDIGFSTFLPIRTDDLTKHQMHSEYYEIDSKNADIINNRRGRLIAVGTTSLRALESACDLKGIIYPKKASTSIFIYPGYKFKSRIDALITNFHLPKSTLLLLVCAFAGRNNIFKAYKEAINLKYRFFSFGDAMLIFKT